LSRETNLAFAPCSTASTQAIESFQRNPYGGTNSSAARECCAKKTKKVISPIKKNWRIIGWFGRVTHIETRPVVSVSVACIYNLLSVYASLAEARNCPHRWIRSTRDAQPISSEVFARRFKIRRGWLTKFFQPHCFCFRDDARASFFQSRKFFCHN